MEFIILKLLACRLIMPKTDLKNVAELTKTSRNTKAEGEREEPKKIFVIIINANSLLLKRIYIYVLRLSRFQILEIPLQPQLGKQGLLHCLIGVLDVNLILRRHLNS